MVAGIVLQLRHCTFQNVAAGGGSTPQLVVKKTVENSQSFLLKQLEYNENTPELQI